MADILIVDDDMSARELLKTVLRYDGHEVHEANDGAEALLLVHRIMPALVIVDLLMPKMDGTEFVRRLRRHSATATVPVIFYTASYLESQAQHLAQLCGVTHIISKPAEPQQIFSAVNAALGQHDTPLPKPAPAEAQQDYLAGLTAALSRKAAHVVPRLEAMIALGLRLASERDPHRLLADFCAAARKIVGAKIALVAIRHQGDSQLRFRFTSGFDDRIMRDLSPALWDADVHQQVLSTRQPRRLHPLPNDIQLPASLQSVDSLLCAPILSPQRVYGWLTLLGSMGGAEFSEEDEALARILAAQVGRIYENGSLYREIKQLNADLEQRIQQRTAQLMDLNKELEAFGYTISHDLRAPLRGVICYSALALECAGSQLDTDARRYIQLSIDSAQRLSRMVDDLLEFSRKGRQALKLEPVDMAALVAEVWGELSQQPPTVAQLQLAPLQSARADRAMMREVWSNLLSNALKYSRNSAQPVIVVTSEMTDRGVQYSIRDNGAGFNAEYAHKLFRVFERLHSGNEFEGTGVGLAIVERIVSRHGGRIWAVSEVGEGATFTFTLPAS